MQSGQRFWFLGSFAGNIGVSGFSTFAQAKVVHPASGNDGDGRITAVAAVKSCAKVAQIFRWIHKMWQKLRKTDCLVKSLVKVQTTSRQKAELSVQEFRRSNCHPLSQPIFGTCSQSESFQTPPKAVFTVFTCFHTAWNSKGENQGLRFFEVSDSSKGSVKTHCMEFGTRFQPYFYIICVLGTSFWAWWPMMAH